MLCILGLYIVDVHWYRQWRIHDFPDSERQPLRLAENLLFCKIFTENCMKMKKLDREGANFPSATPIRKW